MRQDVPARARPRPDPPEDDVSEAPTSPAASRLASPRWLDGRLVLGVLLVLASVLVGARVLSSADRSQEVWRATRELPAGAVLAQGDLARTRVRLLDSSGLYSAAGATPPVGYVVRRVVGAGELLPVAALGRPGDPAVPREVTVPTATGHLPPDLRPRDLVDVYVTPTDKTGAPGTPRLVLEALVVARTATASGLSSSSQDRPVVLTVAPDDVLALVTAMGQGRLDLVRVPPQPRVTP